VAQSGFHLHPSEPPSCEQNKQCDCQELQNGGLWSTSPISP
jgi:hypothetical protein